MEINQLLRGPGSCSSADATAEPGARLNAAEVMLVERAGANGGAASAQPATAGEAERVAAFEASTDLGQGPFTADANAAAAAPSVSAQPSRSTPISLTRNDYFES